MNPARVLTVVMLVTPVASIAQVSYSQARIEPPRLHVCAERQASLAERKVYLDMDKSAIDRERDAIALESARLAVELRNLDSRNPAAVESYNARSADHNRRVEIHNGYVGEMNRAAALLTGEAADFNAYCSTLRFSRR